MKRLLLLSSLFLFFPSVLCAAEPMFHVIVASDLRAGFNANLITDHNSIERLFKSNVPKERLNLVAMKMDEITPDKILQTIKALELTDNDALVLYYSGSAACDAGNGGQFFQLKDEQGKLVGLQRRTLLAALHEKKARLTVMLTDCGNIEDKENATTDKKNQEEESLDKSAQTIVSPEIISPEIISPEIISPIMETLFMKPAGTVDITSSKRGEASFVDTTENKRGSCFTWSLVALFDKHRNNTSLTWQEFTTELADDVKKAFHDSHPEGYKFSPPLNGIVVQTTQTIEIYGTLPGVAPAPVVQQGPRFGVRAITLPGGGVRVTYVLPDGPGARAGFEVGDIISEINGKTIQNEEDYSKAIDDSPKQDHAKVINGKDGRLLNVTFEPGR
jgi:hypothetical protein